jgi:hypothetical protein
MNVVKTNGSLADVQAKVNEAPDDGTVAVAIPGGVYNWNGTLNLHKAITLIGEEGAVLRHNANGSMISAWARDSGHVTVSGLRLVQVSNVGGGRGFLMNAARRETTNNTVRIHDCTFDQNGIFNWSLQCLSNGILVWNTRFIGSGSQHGMGGVIMLVGSPGNYELWRRPLTLGAQDTNGLSNTYLEDCEFLNSSIGCTDFSDNARMVFRHNIVQDAGLGSHGQETSPLGASSFEVYNNTFRISSGNPQNIAFWVHVRGGTGVITGNDMALVPWAGGSQILLTVMSITRSANDNAGGVFCPVEYPAPRQTGWSWEDNNANWGRVRGNPSLLDDGNPGFFRPNGRGAKLDPVYIWDNRGPGAQADTYVVLRPFMPDQCGNGQQLSNYLQRGRDFYVDAGPKPGWTPYTYPHPLRVLEGEPPPPPLPPEPPPEPPPDIITYGAWLNRAADWIKKNPPTPD